MSRAVASLHPRAAVALGLVAAVGLSALLWRPSARAEDPQATARAHELSRAVRAAAKDIIPTVVLIKATTKPRAERIGRDLRGRNPFRGTPFEEFFDDDTMPFHGRQGMPRQQGVGSGVVIDPKGVIVTNSHVVEGADEVLVEFKDGRRLKAVEIKTDEQTDLALLKVKADAPLPAAKLGDSSKMEIGDWVIAVGNPFELAHTVSAGIISGKQRALASGRRAEYIQTDAAIIPGNSGGPLVNLDGEVVGINTAIASSTGGYQGVGFAIPINAVKWVVGQLMTHDRVQRAYLGVSIAQISWEIAARLGVRPNEGVLVTEVFPDTPAARAGMQEWDVVTHFAGRPVNSPNELQQAVEQCPFGSKQELRLTRDGKPVSVSVAVEAMPKKFGMESDRPRQESREEPAYSDRSLGLQLADLSPQIAERLGLEKGQPGVVITGVDPNGLAADAGLREGLVILRVGRKPIRSVEEFEQAMKQESLKAGVMLMVRAGGRNVPVLIRQR